MITAPVPPLHDGLPGVLWLAIVIAFALVLATFKVTTWRHGGNDPVSQESVPGPVTVHPRDTEPYESSGVTLGHPEEETPC